MKLCIVCGAGLSGHHLKTTCTPECKREHRARYKATWRASRIQMEKERLRDYERRRAPRTGNQMEQRRSYARERYAKQRAALCAVQEMGVSL